MTEKQYKYTARIKQPQAVDNVKLDPKGGVLSEREYKTLKRDAYGASLLDKGLLVVEAEPGAGAAMDDVSGNAIPAFEGSGKGKKK
jgi:hypothetical protein